MSEVIKVVIEADSSDFQKEAAAAIRSLENFEKSAKKTKLSVEDFSGGNLGPLASELQLAVGAVSKFNAETKEARNGLGMLADAGKAFGKIGAAAFLAAGAGITASMKSAIDAGGVLSDMMARTGADGENLVILQQMFENAGVSASKVPEAINRMQKALAGVNEDGKETGGVFAELGLRVSDLAAMDPVVAFQALGNAIAGIEDPAARAAKVMEIFGRSGGELLAVMRDTSAWQTATDQIGGLGKTLAENAQKFDEIGDSAAQFGIAMKNIGANVAEIAVPALEWLAEAMQAVNAESFDWKNPFSSKLDSKDKAGARDMAGQWAERDPGNLRSATADAEVAASIKFAAERSKAMETARASEKQIQDEREKQLIEHGKRYQAAQESVYADRLTLEENLQRKMRELAAEGPYSKAAISSTSDPKEAADIAERLSKMVSLEKQLKQVRADSAKQAAATLSDNLDTAEEQQGKLSTMLEELELLREGTSEGKKRLATVREEIALRNDAAEQAVAWGISEEQARSLLKERAAAIKAFEEQPTGTIKERREQRTEKRQEERDRKRDERVAEAQRKREERNRKNNKEEDPGIKDKVDIDQVRKDAEEKRAKASEELLKNQAEQKELVKEIAGAMKNLGAA